MNKKLYQELIPKDISFEELKPTFTRPTTYIEESVYFKDLQKIVFNSSFKGEMGFIDTENNKLLKIIKNPEINGTKRSLYTLLKHPNSDDYPHTFFATVSGGKIFTFCVNKERKIGEFLDEEFGRNSSKHSVYMISDDLILRARCQDYNEEKRDVFDIFSISGQQTSKLVKSMNVPEGVLYRTSSDLVLSKKYENCVYFNYYKENTIDEDDEDDFVALFNYKKEKLIKLFEFGLVYINKINVFSPSSGSEILIYSEEREDANIKNPNSITFMRVSDKKKVKVLETEMPIYRFLVFGNRYLFTFAPDIGFMYSYEMGIEEENLVIKEKFKKRLTNASSSIRRFHVASSKSMKNSIDAVFVCSHSIEQLRINGISNPNDRFSAIHFQDLNERIEFILNQKEEYFFEESSIKKCFRRIALNNISLENILFVLL